MWLERGGRGICQAKNEAMHGPCEGVTEGKAGKAGKDFRPCPVGRRFTEGTQGESQNNQQEKRDAFEGARPVAGSLIRRIRMKPE